MPATVRLLYMRSWMIGWLLAAVMMAFSPWLLPVWLTPVVVLPMVWLALQRRFFWVGLATAIIVCSLRGQLALQQRLPENCNGAVLTLVGSVASLPRLSELGEGRYRQRFEFQVEQAIPAGCGRPAKVLLSYYGDRQLQPGQRWQLSARLRRPWGLSNPGSFNMQAWYATSGIDALGSVRAAAEMLPLVQPSSPAHWHHRQRGRVSAAIRDSGLTATAAAVLAAVTVADKSAVNQQLRALFQRYGISHLLVISGLHIALLAGLAFSLGRVLAAGMALTGGAAGRLPWPECSAFGLALVYAALAGFSVATQRALVMLGCFLLARACYRANHGFNSLLVAAFLLSLANPLVFLGAGFWLSFGAVAVLLWSACWQAGGRIWRLILPQLAVALAMLPVGDFWFGGSSWVAPLANLLMIPVIGCWVIPLALCGAFLTLTGFASAASVCWQLASLPVDALFPAATLLASKAPLFWYTSGSLPALFIAMVGCLVLMLPLRPRGRVACLLLLLPLLLPRPPAVTGPQLDVLDVGQGTAVVFRAAGKTLLYDTGGGSPTGTNLAQMVVLPWLRRAGVRALDEMVVSHGDLDHSAGVDDILASLPVGRLWQGELDRERARQCSAGVAWAWPDGSRFRFLSPAGDTQGNDASCVLQIDAGGVRFLLPGDIGQQQEQQLVRYWGEGLGSQVLLVAHHGSNTSTYQAWLNRVQPHISVITAGYASRFGHPHEQVLARLRRSDAVLHETAADGALNIRVAPVGGLSVTANRDGFKAWWM